MKRFFVGCLLICTVALMLPSAVLARYNPEWTWRTVENDNFTIYYPEGYESFAGRVLSLSDEVYGDISGYLGVTPRHCPIVLNPGTDLFNGFYSPFPSRISLYETPYYSVRGFGPTSDSMDTVFTHEYAHFAHITTRLGWYGKLSPLFGRDSAITNILSPGWLIEGVTTNAETRFSDGGRGRCSYFKGKMLSFSEDEGLWNLSAAGTYPPYQPPQDRFYLAGYYMVDYLNRTYGEDAFARLSRYQAMHPLGLSAEALQEVTRKKPETFYKEFLEDYKREAKAFKDQAKAHSILPSGRVLVSGKMSDVKAHFWTDSGTIMAYVTDYDKKNAFVEIDPASGSILRTVEPGTINSIDRITSMKDPFRVVYAGYYPRLLGGGDLVDTDITLFDLSTRSFKRLTKGAHIFSADITSDKSQFVAVRRNGMWNDLVVMDNDGEMVQALISSPGYLFEAPKWSPDDTHIVCVVKTGANSDIAIVNPLSGTLQTLFESDRFEDNDPSFSPDGTWVVFSSNRSGIWNIYAWDLIKEKLYQLTSVDYGAICPQVSPDGRTLSFLKLHRGTRELCTAPFDPVKGEKYYVHEGGLPPEPDLARLTPPLTATPGTMNYRDVYPPYLHIPYILSNPDELLAGLWILGGDPLGINSYSAMLNYGFDSGHTGYDLSLTNRSFWPDLSIRGYDKADKISYYTQDIWIQEQGLECAVGFNMINRVIPDSIKSTLKSGIRLKWLDSLTNGFDFYRDSDQARSVFAELTVNRSPDAPERDMLPAWGQSVILLLDKTSSLLNTELSGRNAVFSFTQYLPLPFKHHNLALKSVIQEQNGGLSYDKDYSLPRGYSSSDTEGDLYKDKNLLLSAEYHFPIAYVDRGLGLSVLHFNLFKGTAFFDWGAGWDGSFDTGDWTDKARKVVGGSLRTKATLFSMMPIELGMEAGYQIDDEAVFANMILLLGF